MAGQLLGADPRQERHARDRARRARPAARADARARADRRAGRGAGAARAGSARGSTSCRPPRRRRAAALEARLAALEAPGGAGGGGLAERLAQLHEQKDAGLEAVLARLGPLETRLGALEGDRAARRRCARRSKRLEARLEALQGEQGAARAELAAPEGAAGGGEAGRSPSSSRRLHAQKEALAEAVLARLAALEEEVGGRDRQAARVGGSRRGSAALEAPERPRSRRSPGS